MIHISIWTFIIVIIVLAIIFECIGWLRGVSWAMKKQIEIEESDKKTDEFNREKNVLIYK